MKLNGKKVKVVIDAGHGGADPGAVGPSGAKEDEIALKVSKLLAMMLSVRGCEVYMTRRDDTAVSLSGRAGFEEGRDVFVSIHCNAATPQAQGIETIYPAADGKSKALANYVQDAMMKAMPSHKNRGARMSPSPDYNRTLYVLKVGKGAKVLVELEFISHAEMEKHLQREDVQESYAHAIANGIGHYVKSQGGEAQDPRPMSEWTEEEKRMVRTLQDLKSQPHPLLKAEMDKKKAKKK